MNEHRHPTYVDGCYRCNLSQDEVDVDHNAMREAIMSDLSDLERQLADANARADAAEADRDRHANLLDAIGDPDELLIDAHYGTTDNGHGDDLRDRLRRIADAAAAVSPAPAPTTCPTCGSDDPAEYRKVYPEHLAGHMIAMDVVPGYDPRVPCPDSWHQAAT